MNKQQIKLFQSKKTDDWQTPPELYKTLDLEFNFDFDPCPFQSTFNGLDRDWETILFVVYS